jgi:nucleoside-diphosphate-sugar epimerase/uncharacterized membrane protein
MADETKPVVLITGAAGNLGVALTRELAGSYQVVGLDVEGKEADCPLFEVDLTSEDSTRTAMGNVTAQFGAEIAAVIHLAAYFDFSGEDHPLYQKVNIDGTRHLMRALRDVSVERFIYSGTMLVHEAGEPGGTIDEDTPIAPKWAYPKSKAKAEEVIRQERGAMPILLLHLAGLYDEESSVPTLAHQIARIYERDMKAHLYSGDVKAGQSFIHRDDMMRLFKLAVDKRKALPDECVILAGEAEAVPYDELQTLIGRLIHGEKEWETFSVPKPIAKIGAFAEVKAEPLIPDDIDKGEKPFIRPFMIDMAEDHYALDISLARKQLGWEPRHSIRTSLPTIVAKLKADPAGWYEKNGLTPPDWLKTADARGENPEDIRSRHEEMVRDEHARFIWAHFANAALGTWMIVSPATMGYADSWLGWSDMASGILLFALGLLSLSWRLSMVRFAAAAVGLWILFAPLVFWTPSAAAYLNGTLVGTLVMGLALCVRPEPGVSPIAQMTGPDMPPGWSYNPSSWLQRMPIILLAFVGLYFSRYLAAYQLGHIDAAWDPFFGGTRAGLNGTEDVVTSDVSEAFPIPDAGMGVAVYLLEIVIGLVGSQRRWRTMPWVTIAFGILIVPLGIVSIGFIIIQPIVIGTFCTLCLIGAAAMLLQIPYSLDELVATSEFLYRKWRKGEPVIRIFFTGDTDEGEAPAERKRTFELAPNQIVGSFFGGGIGLPWNLVLSLPVALWLMFTPLSLGSDGGIANVNHVVGSLALTFAVIALAETGRPARYVNVALGAILIGSLVFVEARGAEIASAILAGIALIALALPKGKITRRWGLYHKLIV